MTQTGSSTCTCLFVAICNGNMLSVDHGHGLRCGTLVSRQDFRNDVVFFALCLQSIHVLLLFQRLHLSCHHPRDMRHVLWHSDCTPASKRKDESHRVALPCRRRAQPLRSTVDSAQHVGDLSPTLHVQPGKRILQNQHPRLCQQARGDSRPPCLSATQRDKWQR